jgi:replicative superfamily II helicase
VLYHWISSAPTKEIEEAHHLFFGAIKKMGEEFSWLMHIRLFQQGTRCCGHA